MESSEKQYHCCSFCDHKCESKCQLESHMSSHTREKPFFCDQCKRGFSRKFLLKLHIRTVHEGIKLTPTKNHKCSLCPFATNRRGQLESHTRTHTGERVFPCPYPQCEYAGKCSQDIKQHKIYKHTTARDYFCPFPNCDYRGKIKATVKRHALSHTQFKPFVCHVDGCSYQTNRADSLTRHKQCVHSDGYKPFACTKCNYQTASKELLKLHRLTHLEEKAIKCTFSGCSYSCKYKDNLRHHIVSRHKEKTFKCDFVGCSSTAASRTILENHKKVVHYEKLYKCPSCEYRAAYLFLLKQHIESHSTSQRIPCPSKGCTFQAKHRLSLRWHMQYHKANLGCPVDGCGYVGVSTLGRKRHMKLHNPTGRPFHCPICPKHYKNNSLLSRHLQSHTNEKPFKCPVCNFGFASRAGVIQHVCVMHSKVLPQFVFDKESICDHCNVNFGCAIGLAIHRMKLKTAVVVLKRLQVE